MVNKDKAYLKEAMNLIYGNRIVQESPYTPHQT